MSDSTEKSPLILLVDDDTGVREFIADTLKFAGHEVLAAGSGEEAMKLFAEYSARIWLLLTDVVMPGLFGDQLALRLAEIKPALRVILMSGNSPDSLEGGIAIEDGVNFLRKPFSIVDLNHALTRQRESRIPIAKS